MKMIMCFSFDMLKGSYNDQIRSVQGSEEVIITKSSFCRSAETSEGGDGIDVRITPVGLSEIYIQTPNLTMQPGGKVA